MWAASISAAGKTERRDIGLIQRDFHWPHRVSIGHEQRQLRRQILIQPRVRRQWRIAAGIELAHTVADVIAQTGAGPGNVRARAIEPGADDIGHRITGERIDHDRVARAGSYRATGAAGRVE